MKWTKEQYEAITSEGSDILVSAAAGSGKTAVLVERMIQKILRKDNPIHIDELLVVTFTNAAAQEMKNRVGKALEKAMQDNPSSMHLKKQMSLLQQASITTLHSFCLDIVRKYAYLLDLDPQFRIADERETDLIKQEVMGELLEAWYGLEDAEEREQFFAVVDRFSGDRSDAAIEQLILSLYQFAIQHPWPDKWLEDVVNIYQIPQQWTETDLEWLTLAKREIKQELIAIQEDIQLAHQLASQSDGPYLYLETIELDRTLVQTALDHMDLAEFSWEDLRKDVISQAFSRLSGKRVECDETIKEKVRSIRDGYKKRWENLKKNWFTRDLNRHVELIQELAPIVETLMSLVKQFHHKYMEQKRAQALVDFSDLEHYCLQLLIDRSSSATNIVPSSVACQLQQQYKELLIDEYQDINLVQETILNVIRDDRGLGNKFMVGDVKQSIYRFRHAEPSLFIEKFNAFSQSGSNGKRIDLAKNFRSRSDVLSGVNFIFKQLLSEELGEIDYDEDSFLVYGNTTYDEHPFKDPEPELLIIDRETIERENTSDREDDELDLEKSQLEAKAYAKKIKHWIGQDGEEPLKIVDPNTGQQRNVQYRDIVILLRSISWAPVIMDELKQHNIPVYAELNKGYFEAVEIQLMLSFLKVIDNPRQDIPLAAVLRSPMIGFNEEELAQIRLADKQQTYYDALVAFEKKGVSDATEKASYFLNLLKRFRQSARQGALSDLIWQIYRETGYYDFVGGMPGGRQRQANLRALYDRARSYESTSFRGLFRFLRFIEQMEERGDDLGSARALSEQEDVVRLMTIHKSKGLEFPIVIVGGMDRPFYLRDLYAPYLLDKDFGFATKFIDPEKRITYPTLFYTALQKEKRRQQLSEEMRVLYVALTRAKEKLVMVGTVNSFAKKVDRWKKVIAHTDWVIPTHLRLESTSYLDWIGLSLIRHPEGQQRLLLEDERMNLEQFAREPSNWTIKRVTPQEISMEVEDQQQEFLPLKKHIQNWQPLELLEGELVTSVQERLSFQYPHKEATKARAKQSVTEIKRQYDVGDAYSDRQLVTLPPVKPMGRPKFLQEDRQLTPAERGTAMHTVMQHLPFSEVLSSSQIQQQIQEMIDQEILTKDEAKAIDVLAIERFYQTNIAQMMIQTSKLFREVPFSLTLRADEVYPSWNGSDDERVLIQGVIDCLIQTEDGWIMLDYKTDILYEGLTMEDLIDRYLIQMSLYKRAVETIWKQPVKQTFLYFFDESTLVDMSEAVDQTIKNG